MNLDIIDLLSARREALTRLTYMEGTLYRNDSIGGYKVGRAVGNLNAGYYNIKHRSKVWRVHRLIFLMFHGYLPKVVDHIDGNPLNNRIENLRAATRTQNNRNTRLRKDNTSGVKGVSWCNRSQRWVAKLCIGGGRKIYLGCYKDLKEAITVMHEARLKYHKDFANNGKREGCAI